MQSKVGVIADTHGLLRPEAIEFLERCDLIGRITIMNSNLENEIVTLIK